MAEPVGPYGYGWRPSWRCFGGGHGWRTWDPYRGGRFWADQVDVRTVTQCEASAEVLMRRGSKPRVDQRAFEAREVLADLAGKSAKPR